MAEERSLETLKQFLKDKYKANDKIERLFYPEKPLPLADCYLDLALVEEKEIKIKKTANVGSEPIASSSSNPDAYADTQNESYIDTDIQKDLSSRESFLHEYELIEHSQKKLEVKAILAECKHLRKRIYIEGAAGAGKSTLIRYVANEWAHDQVPWSQYEWVFYIRLRELSIKNYSPQLEELLKIVSGELFQGHGNHLKTNELNNLLQTLAKQPQKVLWLLDGYDELNSTIVNCNWWQDLLYSNYDILMTSRPGGAKKNLGVNLNLAVLGFNNEQVKKYIRNFFNVKYTPEAQTVDAAECLKLIKGNSNLWSLAHTPIQLELMCSIWEDLEKKQALPLTELYRVMLERLLRRCADREGILPKRAKLAFLKKLYANYLTYMKYLAFLGMQTQRVILSEKQLNQAYKILPEEAVGQVDFQEQLEALGLIKVYNHGKQAEFVHLTFQEFFAARYVASAIKAFSENKPHSLSHQDLLDFVSKTKWDSFYEVMWRFVAGILGGRPNANEQTLEYYGFRLSDSSTSEEFVVPKSHQRLQTLQTFFDLLLQEPRETLEAFELPLLVSCLAEASFPNILQKETIKLHFEKWLKFYWLSKYWHELNGSKLQKLVQILKSNRELMIGIEPMLLVLLQVKNKNRRYAAISAVRELLSVSADEELQKSLLMLLKDKDKDVRHAAAQAIGMLGAAASEELQKNLLMLLKDQNKDVRRAAAQAVGMLGAAASEELQKGLLPLVHDKNLVTRCVAIESVGKLAGSANKELQIDLLRLLKKKNTYVRCKVAKTVELIGGSTSEELQKGLLWLLQDEDSDVRSAATAAVRSLGASVSEELQKELLSMLQDKDDDIRNTAIEAIGVIGTSVSDELQKILLTFLKDKDSDMRCVGVKIVGKLGIKASGKLQKSLMTLLQDEDCVVRRTAVQAVGGLGISASEELQKNLSMLLQDKDIGVRLGVAEAVRGLGSATNEALQKGLLVLLQDKEEEVRDVAAEAVGQLIFWANEEFQQSLLQLLQDKNDDTRYAVISAMGELDISANEELQKALLVSLQDKNDYVRCAAVYAVVKLGSLAVKELRKNLLLVLQDKDIVVRYVAAKTVGELGISASEELQTGLLLPLLQDKEWLVRHVAVEAVKKLGAAMNEALQAGLLLRLQDKHERVRLEAGYALEKIGAVTNEYLQKKLLQLVKEKNWQVSFAAKKALTKTKSGVVLLCQEIYKTHSYSIPSSRLIVSSKDIVKVNQYGQLDCLRVCGTVLQNIIHNEFSHNLTKDEWTLAMVRKKAETNDPNQATSSNSFFKPFKDFQSHAFLILEGVKDSVRFAIKFDLYAMGKKQSQSSGQKVAIKITEIDDFTRLQELADNSCSMVHGISREQAEQLLKNIKQDQTSAERGEIVYSLTGNGSSSSTSTQQKHSCISWCLEKWQQAGLPLQRKWYDTIVVVPKAYLIGPKAKK